MRFSETTVCWFILAIFLKSIKGGGGNVLQSLISSIHSFNICVNNSFLARKFGWEKIKIGLTQNDQEFTHTLFEQMLVTYIVFVKSPVDKMGTEKSACGE